MAKPDGKDEKRERFLCEAARLYDAFIDRAGPGSTDTFDDMEEQAEDAARRLIVQLLADRLSAEPEPQEVWCPQCGRRMRLTKTPGRRNLETASGVVAYERLHAICDRCGESFSPDRPPIGRSASGRVESAQAQSV